MGEPITADVARGFAPPRPADAHKGTFGHALIIAGAPGYTGAGCMAAEAAARAGAGLVTLACPAALNPIFEVKLTEVMTLPVGHKFTTTLDAACLSALCKAADARTAVGLGPGIGRLSHTAGCVRDFLRRNTTPIVIDADGLNVLAAVTDSCLPPPAPCVLTPHPGEMARLTGLETRAIHADREGVARDWAARWRCTVVLKGAGTLVAAPDGRTWINTTGNQGLATGGTGDVLTGLITGLLAQGCEPAAAACLAVFLHGSASDRVAGEGSPRAMIAGDLLPALAGAWRALLGDELEGGR